MFTERLLISLVGLIIGAVFCFAGYRLFRVLMVIWGFFIGFIMGAQVIASFLGTGLLATPSGWATGIACGLVLAVLAYALYTAAIAILGGSIGYITGVTLMTGLGIANPEYLVVIVSLTLAIFFAILILVLDLARVLIIAITALSGASAIVTSILLLFGVIQTSFFQAGAATSFIERSPGWVMLWLAIAVIGGTFQMQNTQRYKLQKYVLAQKGKIPERP
ncbi:MAG TPA: DUF4203 domain-containing protein [Ktedonobacteraceae bacterium]|nr:DUF4203 domain-containing protein [Ktedonobacteraceae bacterium]